MRLCALLLTLVLVTALGTGCFVNDLLDDANSKVSEHSDKTDGKTSARRGKGRPAAAPEPDAAQAGEEGEQGPGWWETAKTVSGNERPGEIVECRVSGRSQFMKRGDCLSRGGTAR